MNKEFIIEEENYQILNDEILRTFSTALNTDYQKWCEKFNKYFQVFILEYSSKIMFCSLWLSKDFNSNEQPVCLQLLIEKEGNKQVKDLDKTFSILLNYSQNVWDEICPDENWEDYETIWSKISHKNIDFEQKITRENIGLTIEADKILKDNPKNF